MRIIRWTKGTTFLNSIILRQGGTLISRHPSLGIGCLRRKTYHPYTACCMRELNKKKV